MKKRSIIWAIFIILGIVCTIGTKCHNAKAEGWIPDWADPGSPFDTPAPLPTPSPDPRLPSDTPEPTEQVTDMRGVPLDANRGTISMKTGYYTRNAAENTGTVTWTSATGGGSVSFPVAPWGRYPYFTNYTTVTNNGSSILSFLDYNQIPNTNSGYSTVSARRNGISLEIKYSPAVSLDGVTSWTNENAFKWNLCWALQCIPTLAVNDYTSLQMFNISAQTITTEIPCTILIGISSSDGVYRWLQYETTCADLINYYLDFNLDVLPDGVYAQYLEFHIVLNYQFRNNPLYYKFSEYYNSEEGSSVPEGSQYYPSMTFVGSSAARSCLICRFTDDSRNRSWLAQLIRSIFIPSAEDINELVRSYLLNPDQGATSDIIHMRETLYDIFNQSSDVGQNTSFDLPALSVPVGGSSYEFFHGFSFDLADFYNGNGQERPVLSTLMNAVRTFNSVVIFSAFFASAWALITRFFGLHLWSGVYGEDIEEADTE